MQKKIIFEKTLIEAGSSHLTLIQIEIVSFKNGEKWNMTDRKKIVSIQTFQPFYTWKLWF